MTVKLIKIMNGEEICAKVTSEDDNTITIENPAIVMLRPDPKNGNNLAVSMGPYCPHTKDAIPVNKAHVLYTVEPNTELLNGYNKAFGSGLVVPNNQLLKG